MDYQDLSNAAVGEDLTSSLQFDDTKYTPLEEFVQFVRELPEKPVHVPIGSLCVNGKVIRDSFDKYLSAEGESSSALKEMQKTPLHYRFYKQQAIKPKSTDHLALGTFAHQAFLEPKKFDKVVKEPEFKLNTNDGLIQTIQWYQGLLSLPADCILSELKQYELRAKLDMLESKAKAEYSIVQGDHAAIIKIIKQGYDTYGGGILPKLLKHAKAEISMYGVDPQTGLKVKIRPDAILLEESIGINAIVSLKTTSSSTIEAFARDCAKFKYEVSEGMYLDVASHVTGRKFTATIMVVLQTVIPFQIMLLYWDAEDLEVGKYKYYQAMEQVRSCRENGRYLGYDVRAEEGNYGLIPFKLPAYVKLELPNTEN